MERKYRWRLQRNHHYYNRNEVRYQWYELLCSWAGLDDVQKEIREESMIDRDDLWLPSGEPVGDDG